MNKQIAIDGIKDQNHHTDREISKSDKVMVDNHIQTMILVLSTYGLFVVLGGFILDLNLKFVNFELVDKFLVNSLYLLFLALHSLLIVPKMLLMFENFHSYSDFTKFISMSRVNLERRTVLRIVFLFLVLAVGLIFINLAIIFLGYFFNVVEFNGYWSIEDFIRQYFMNIGSFFIFYLIQPHNWIIAITAAVFEEIIFRGIVLTILLQKYSKSKSIIISSILFSAFHLLDVLFAPNIPVQILNLPSTFFMGLLFAMIFLKTENIAFAIEIHLLVNIFTNIVWFNSLFQSILSLEAHEMLLGSFALPFSSLLVLGVLSYMKFPTDTN